MGSLNSDNSESTASGKLFMIVFAIIISLLVAARRCVQSSIQKLTKLVILKLRPIYNWAHIK